jgi:RHS repeat-associated protein
MRHYRNTIGHMQQKQLVSTSERRKCPGLHTYIFNAENQITQMDGGAAVYGYDGEGRRMKKTVGSETTYYFYSPGGLLCEFSTSNAISAATAASSSDKTYYHTTDKLGSALLVMNAAGLVIENNRTLPYGEAWLAENTPSTNDKKFTTYQRDSESGLDYAMNRFSSSSNGSFLSPDKGPMQVAMPITLNRYIYTNDDPINNVDPTGMQCFYSVCVTTPPPSPPATIDVTLLWLASGGQPFGPTSGSGTGTPMGTQPIPSAAEIEAIVEQAIAQAAQALLAQRMAGLTDGARMPLAHAAAAQVLLQPRCSICLATARRSAFATNRSDEHHCRISVWQYRLRTDWQSNCSRRLDAEC